ncbi:SAM-dependent methyltransferase [Streptomyces cinerochromogenes]|uniref:SAM-dependent methyltransferase n=1 Tax=Streptomyces cinerochromogenes TaxID=66422 RepID=A0ABW7BM15_9ACTN
MAHNARVWNHWLGGRDHYEVDRQVGEQVGTVLPVGHGRACPECQSGLVHHAVRVDV